MKTSNKRSLQAIIGRAFKLNVRMVDSPKNWTDEEYEILKKYYPTEGINCISKLNGRTAETVRTIAYKLGIHYIAKSVWTTEKIELLKSLTFRDDTTLDKFPGIEAWQFDAMVKKLNLNLENRRSNRDWSIEEDNILKQYYPIEGKEVYKRLINRKPTSCRDRAQTLNLKRIPDKFVNWKQDEDNILKQYYPIEGGDVYKRLPGRDITSCRNRAAKLHLKSECIQDMSFCMTKVRCIETGEIFNSIAEANLKYKSNIAGYMQRIMKNPKSKASSGQLSDGTRLHWEYIDELKSRKNNS